MTCKCGSERMLHFNGKHSDLCTVSVPHLELEHDGYAPHIPWLCSGDYSQGKVCLDCGTLQNFKPLTDDEIKELFDGDR